MTATSAARPANGRVRWAVIASILFCVVCWTAVVLLAIAAINGGR